MEGIIIIYVASIWDRAPKDQHRRRLWYAYNVYMCLYK